MSCTLNPKEMTAVEKRIAICKDVLKQMKYFDLRSVYFADGNYNHPDGEYNWHFRDLHKLDDAQQQWNKVKKCSVCAIGSCLLSYVHLFNNTTIGDLVYKTDRHNIINKLKGVFTEHQLDLIESAFENSDNNGYNPECKLYYTKYCTSHADRKPLLRAIMKNIIKNNGIFKPKQEFPDSDRIHYPSAFASSLVTY